jgi:hypothetical protein
MPGSSLAAKPSIGKAAAPPSQEAAPLPIAPSATKKPAPPPEPPKQPELPAAPPPSPGFFGGIIAWFKGLFGG